MRKIFAYIIFPFACVIRLIEIVLKYFYLAIAWISMKLGTYIIVALLGEEELITVYGEKKILKKG